MEDISITYECLIRRAYQCARFGVPGANADLYRRYERLVELSGTDNKNTNNYEYTVSLYEISNNIINAISFVLKKQETKLSKEQNKELLNIMQLLLKPDKKKVDDSIIKADEIMIEIGLYPQ